MTAIAEVAKAGDEARIILKINAITDTEAIALLYDASQAGVKIDLLVRGICCLVPGRPGLSENITVRSVVGRFLEHSRVYWFRNGGQPEGYIGSADLMDRNLHRRVEVLAPILDPEWLAWLRDVLLERYLTDEVRTRIMRSDGSYDRIRRPDSTIDVHALFMG